MVTTVLNPTEARNRIPPGEMLEGVVRIALGGYSGSGVLLFDGRAVLTAAHLLEGVLQASGSSATVFFDSALGLAPISTSEIEIAPFYDPVNSNGDLALLWLPSSAPVSVHRHGLYRDSDELGQLAAMAGYGAVGTGASGAGQAAVGWLGQAWNRVDADAGRLKQVLGGAMGWSPEPGSVLVADFDDGSAAHDALGRLLGVSDLGLGLDEGLIAPGDSGGPLFLQGLVAGVASYTASLTRGTVDPDVDAEVNSSYGELAFWQRVSHYQEWIDQTVREAYRGAPTNRAEVVKSVVEGAPGQSTTVFFLVEFVGTRRSADEWVSVDYATRDGSAVAGFDYLPAIGRLVLYPGESAAVIPVEVIGDALVEPDETFFLDVFNPVGGGLGEGVLQLSAVRTVVNDDGL